MKDFRKYCRIYTTEGVINMLKNKSELFKVLGGNTKK